jgi:AcrR family transcriptional regulator
MMSTRNHARIVRSAYRLFAEQGYANVSVDDIAADANLTKGAVYYGFKDKRDLFHAACKQVLTEISKAATTTTMDHVEHDVMEIVTGGEKLFDAYESPGARRLLLVDGPSVLGIDDWTALQEPLRIELGEHALGHLADAGLLKPELVPMMAHLLFGAFTQGVLQIAASDEPQRASREARDAYGRLAMGLLGGSA